VLPSRSIPSLPVMHQLRSYRRSHPVTLHDCSSRNYEALEATLTIRPSAIGKKNWLFIYSLVVSCQRHDKDPLAYPRNVLRRLPTTDHDQPRRPRSAHPGALAASI